MSDGAVRVVVLGSTGSIGVQTLEVVRALNEQRTKGESLGLDNWPRFEVVGLTAGRNAALLGAQAAEFGVERTVLAERDGAEAVTRLVRETPCDLVVAAMVGVAGLAPTLAAIEKRLPVALANKETLVAAGRLMDRMDVRLLPIDSEHSAIWQCLGGGHLGGGTVFGGRVLLTASGGPFRGISAAEAFNKAPDEALRHPRWTMGRKITIDSATMVNKAFEMIEARWLFALNNKQISVLIHPQSIVHSMVEHEDGSLIAQLGSPDMKGPIGYALLAALDEGYVQRIDAGARRLSFSDAIRLDFEPACEERWEALSLARRVIDESWTDANSALGAVFNAANEVAVDAFLSGAVPFGRITQVCRQVMQSMHDARASSLEQVLAVDAHARREALGRIAAPAGGVR